MVDLSRNWLATLPSITKFWFYACLITSIIFTLPALPYISETKLSSYLSAAYLSLDWDLIRSGQIWRLVTPFLVIGAFIPGLISFTFVCLTILGIYCRELEETYYSNPRGAAQLTTTIIFGAAFLLAMSKLIQAPFYALPLIFFIVTHLTTLNPYQTLGTSNVLLRWHLPYILLTLIALTAPSMTGQAFVGILIGYAFHLMTVRLYENFGLRLWVTPRTLIYFYEKYGIGQRKILFTQAAGHSINEAQNFQ